VSARLAAAVLAAYVGLLAAAAAVRAQPSDVAPPAASCPYASADLDTWRPLDPELEPALWQGEANSWPASRAQLLLLEKALREDTRLPLIARTGLANLLVDVIARFNGSKATADRLRLADFKPEPCPEVVDSSGLPSAPTCAYRFPAAGIEVPPGGTGAGWDCAGLRRLASYVVLIRSFLTQWNEGFVAQADQSLRDAAKAWENYVLHGYSQYPWELFINGLFTDESAWGPGQFKVIVLHPSVGVLIGQPTADEVIPLAGLLMVEALGFVHYTKQHEQYFGIGAGVSAISVQPDALSAALLVHFASLHIGVSYGLGKDIENEVGVFVTLDLTSDLDNASLNARIPEQVLKAVGGP
jgi:hypothetical protein